MRGYSPAETTDRKTGPHLLDLRFLGPFSAARIILDDDPLRPEFGKKITRLAPTRNSDFESFFLAPVDLRFVYFVHTTSDDRERPAIPSRKVEHQARDIAASLCSRSDIYWLRVAELVSFGETDSACLR
jgi:hypothetical protein